MWALARKYTKYDVITKKLLKSNFVRIIVTLSLAVSVAKMFTVVLINKLIVCIGFVSGPRTRLGQCVLNFIKTYALQSSVIMLLIDSVKYVFIYNRFSDFVLFTFITSCNVFDTIYLLFIDSDFVIIFNAKNSTFFTYPLSLDL